jgi:hypothetical protein
LYNGTRARELGRSALASTKFQRLSFSKKKKSQNIISQNKLEMKKKKEKTVSHFLICVVLFFSVVTRVYASLIYVLGKVQAICGLKKAAR